MHTRWLAVTTLLVTLSACKRDECEIGESPCNGPTTYLECGESSSHVPDLSSDFNRFIEHSCGELFSVCEPRGDDDHECVLGFEAETCDVLPIGSLEGESDLVAVHVGDLSDDGHADILLVSRSGLSLRRHTPEGIFAPPEALPEQTRPIDSVSERRAWLRDLDGDGRLDIVHETHGLAGPERESAYRVDALLVREGGFEARDLGVDLPIGYVGDLEDDGQAEVVAIAEASAIIVRFEGDAFVSTVVPIEPMAGARLRSVVAADVYGTGASLLIAWSSERSYALERDGDGYGLADIPSLSALDRRSVFADFNGDGADDLVELPEYERTLHVRLSNADGTFREETVSLPHRPPVFDASVLGDVDGDGVLDLVLDHDGGVVSVVLNDGEGRFMAPRSFQLDPAPFAFTVAPLDSTNAQADLVTLGDRMLGFVPRSCF